MAYQIETLKKLVKSDVPANMRLARLVAKGKNKKLDESMGVFIPALSNAAVQLVTMDSIGIEWVRGKLETLQESLIKKQAESGKLAVFDSVFDTEAMLAAMKAENSTARFSKESIAAWFDANLREIITARIKEKMPNLNESNVSRMVENYLAAFQVCAEREANRSMTPEVKAQLLRVMELLPEDHESPVALRIAEILPTIPSPQALADVL